MLCFGTIRTILLFKPARAVDGGGGEAPPDTGNTVGDLVWEKRTCAYGMGLLGWLLDRSLAYIQKADMGTVTNTAGDGFDIPLVNNLQAA